MVIDYLQKNVVSSHLLLIADLMLEWLKNYYFCHIFAKSKLSLNKTCRSALKGKFGKSSEPFYSWLIKNRKSQRKMYEKFGTKNFS